MKTFGDRIRALDSRVNIGNDSPCWFKKPRIVWGVTLDGHYVGAPRCKSAESALRKAEALSRELKAQPCPLGKPLMRFRASAAPHYRRLPFRQSTARRSTEKQP
jgi:hypothetical protein